MPTIAPPLSPTLAPLFAGLNPSQHDAATSPGGPLLVLAGPGSGKTRVLTHRVAYLVEALGVPPWRILAVTFTNKAAKNMVERLGVILGPEASRELTVGTFHAVCARILRREADTAGRRFSRQFVIVDSDDQLKAVRRALEELNVSDKQYRPQAVHAAISKAKNELIGPEDYQAQTYWHEVAGRVYKRYQAILETSNAMDFDDLLYETATLMRDNLDVRRRYQERYSHLLVDEFQDTNTAQYELLKYLAGQELPDAPHNLFVVGDEDQSIYRWRGADYRNLDRFRRDFPGAETILLEQNYRSTQRILDAASAVISRNGNRTHKELWTEGGDGTSITLFEAYDEEEEAVYVVREILRRVESGADYGEFAIMYRTNPQSQTLERALVQARVPYQLVGATRFYERREVKDIIAYLRLVFNPLDELALERVINVPTRGIGPKAWAAVRETADQFKLPAWTAVQLLTSDEDVPPNLPGLDSRSRNALVRFADIMAELITASDQLPLVELFDYLLEAIRYEEHLRDGTEEGDDRWENVKELRGVAAQFVGMAPRDDLGAMLESVALVSDVDRLVEGTERVTLLTLHAAKGLEFPVVFIVGLEETFLPHSRSTEDQESLAEERRLFYVGLTRAKKKVYLVHAFRRNVFGSFEPRERSRFVEDVPPELLESAAGGSAYSRMTRWETPSSSGSWSGGGRSGSGGARNAGGQREGSWSSSSRDGDRSGSRRSHAPARSSVSSAATAGSGGVAAAVARSAGPSSPSFKAGDKVNHPTLGTGIVVTSTAREGDEEVTVAFNAGGVKKLLQSFARLERAQ